MAIVARGLGQPEDGSLVAGGLGAAEVDANAMHAVLSGTGTLTATLTAAGTETPTEEGTPYRPKFRLERIEVDEGFVLTDDDLAALALVLLEV